MNARHALLSLLILPTSIWAADFEAPGIRSAVDRQLAPYGLPGWHSLTPARNNTESVQQTQRPETIDESRARTAEANRLLDTIQISSVDFQDLPLQDALAWLRAEVLRQSRVDLRRENGALNGLIIVSTRISNRRDTFDPKISLQMESVSAREVLTRLGEPFGLELQVNSHWASLVGY